MKKNPWFVLCMFITLIFTGLCASCPELDKNAHKPGLEVWRNISGSPDAEVKVLDVDPEEKALVYLFDPVMNNIIPGNFRVLSGSITVKRDEDVFLVSGAAGGMGVVTFTNLSETKEAKLYVFIRNWKNSDVYRHTLEPDPVNYRFRMPNSEPENQHTWWIDPVARSGAVAAVHGNVRDNSFAIYRLIIDRGFHYEAPDGLSSRSTGLHGDTVRESWKDLADGSSLGRKLHLEPHILYHPLGNYPYEPQDNSWKEDFLRKPVFAFVLHYDLDGDMVGGYADRQRLELKTMDNSYPATYSGGGKTYVYEGGTLAGLQEGSEPRDARDVMYSLGGGDTFTHRWKFKLPANFRVSTEYTHIHQIKPEGADNGNPTFTLTCRKKSNGDEVMQLIYRGPIREVIGDREVPSANWYPQEVPLAPFLGEWIRAEETVTYDSPGAYRIKLVRIRDMSVLLQWEYNPAIYNEEDPFVMFRKGNTYVRQKTGVYRRIMHMTPFGLPNPDDPVQEYYNEGREVRVLFADFEMDKWKN